MPNEKTPTWTSTQAYAIACICLLMGIAVGYLVRGAGSVAPTVQAGAQAAPPVDVAAAQQQVTPEQLKRMADTKAQPLLAQLQSDPKNAQLLAEIGNIYYDTQSFPDAIGYYEKSLTLREDPNVRTDMGTAYFYAGDADRALLEFGRVLKAHPGFDNALFNTGMVKFQAKMDVNGAIEAWQQMLQLNPNHPRRAEIERLIANAREHANVKPGQKTSKPAM